MTQDRFRRVAEDFFVAPQLAPEDFKAARAQGIRTVINNRPDGEAPDQLDDAEAKACAEAEGLSYAFVPVPTSGIRPEAIEAFAQAIARHEGPYLAYCRSGTRSCHVWAFVAARDRPAAEILRHAAAAGYDLRPALPILERIASQDRG